MSVSWNLKTNTTGKKTRKTRKTMTKILFLADTHGFHDTIELPEADILVHCGDATGRGRLAEVKNFLDWLEKQPYKEKIFIAGNHDFLFEKDRGVARGLVEDRNFTYLEDDEYWVDPGLKIYGAPWQPWFHDWAFNLSRGDEIAAKWRKIPEDTDILVTHGPPKGILDLTLYTKERVGCEELLKRVKEVKPKIHAFGHIHEAYGVKEGNDTIFVNAANCTLQYRATNRPIVLTDENGKWEVTWEVAH
jgi:Icc-related predicted phosphoesterase